MGPDEIIGTVTLKDGTPLAVRVATELDYPYILSTYTKARFITKEQTQAMCTEVLLKSKALVACTAETPGYILGYALVEGRKLHYLGTKREWRRIGVATGLLRFIDPTDFGTKTPDGIRFLYGAVDRGGETSMRAQP